MANTSAELLSKFELPIVVPPVEEFHNGNYINFIAQSFQVFVQIYQNTGKSFFDMTTFLNNLNILLSKYNKDLFSYCVWIVFGAVVLTLVRGLINRIVLNLLFKYKLLKPKNKVRFGESLYSLIFYSIAFTLEYSIEQDTQFLADPHRFWANYSLSNPLSAPVKILLLLESSHYLHCLGTVFFLNPWNSKDSAIMAFHHFISLALILLGTLSKTLPFSVPLLYLFDICDVVLETFKCSGYVELRSKMTKEIITFGSFGLLLIVWFVCRLYYYPMRFLYPLALYLNHNPVESWVPFVFGIFALSGFSLSMNAYWTVLMMKILHKAIRGEQPEDIRETDENGNVTQLKGDKMKAN